MKIAFIHPTDLYIDNDAITNYIRDILNHSSVNKNYKIIHYGISKYSFSKRQIIEHGNKNFYPIFNQLDKKFLPLTLKYMYLLWQKKFSLQFKDSILSFHQVEWALPFLYPQKVGPTIVTIHGASKFNRIAWDNKIKIWFYDLVEKLVIAKADKIITVSRDGYKYYNTRYPNIAEKFVYIPTFVNENMFFPIKNRKHVKKKWGFQEKDIVLMYVGRLAQEKGLDILAYAFKILTNTLSPYKSKVVLAIVGDGPQKKHIESIIKEQKITNVKFFGELKHEKIPEILNCADLSVLPSAFEGTPLSALESAACGVPVIGFNVGDMSEIVQEGINGYLSKDRTPESLAQAIINGIKEKDKMHKFSRESVKKYWASIVIPNILKLYDNVFKYSRLYKKRN